ncbi:MAG: Fic family protein [Nanoarchaeota archaeon]
MIKNDIIRLFCFRCYHTWKKRIEAAPKYCPKCKTPYWNRPRKKISKEFVVKMQETILKIHNTIIQLSGGEMGMRDEGGAYNSTYKLLNHQHKNQRNPQSIGAFALNEFAKRHYFVDGNKRTAYAIAKIFMLVNGCHLKIQYKDATNFIIEIAKYNSKVTFEEIKTWLSDNCTSIDVKDVENYLNKTALNLMLGEE